MMIKKNISKSKIWYCHGNGIKIYLKIINCTANAMNAWK
jgi:hypothetical protein